MPQTSACSAEVGIKIDLPRLQFRRVGGTARGICSSTMERAVKMCVLHLGCFLIAEYVRGVARSCHKRSGDGPTPGEDSISPSLSRARVRLGLETFIKSLIVTSRCGPRKTNWNRKPESQVFALSAENTKVQPPQAHTKYTTGGRLVVMFGAASGLFGQL